MAENNLGRNITFPIYYDTVVNGTATQHETGLVIHKATVETSVMSLGDKITGDVYYANNSLQVTMQEYIVYNDVRYILVSPPTIIREGMVSENGELKGMTKYSFVFYHPMYVLSNFPFSDVAVSEDEKRYLSENKVFSWIGKPQDFIDKLNKNLEGTEWIVVKSSNFPQDTENELSDVLKFDNNTIADALKTGYETWGLPYVIDQIRQEEQEEQGYSSEKKFKVIFGLPSNAIMDGLNEYVFRMGQGVGLKNNSRTPRNNKIVTRIAGYGSENNIPYGYPQIQWYGESNAKFTYGDHAGVYDNVTIGGRTFAKFVSYPIYDGIVGGRYVKLIKHPFTRNHLMPSVYRQALFNKVSPYLSNGSTNSYYDPDIELVDYYDANTDSYHNQINLSSPSYEIHAFEDIKPELGAAAIVGVQPIDDDGTDADGWDDTMNDDGKYLQNYFKLTLPQLDFDIYACAAITEEMQINMRSGACIGCTFPVQVDWEDYKKNFYDDDGNFDQVIGQGHPRNASKYPDSSSGSITVIVQKEYSTFGLLMPNIYQQPTSGDEFVILGISLPDTYVTSAEGRLDDEMRAYMLANNVHYYDYPLKFDEYFLATHTNILSQIRTNTQVKFQFANEDPITLFVKQIVIKYGENTLPQYDITLTDSVEVVLNQIGKVADDVEKLSALVSVLRQSYNRNVWGEIAKKLSKTSNDTAQGEITFLQGLKIGSNGNNGIAPNGDATLNDVNVSGDLTITHVETPQGGAPIVKEYGITNDGDISGEGLEIGNFANSGLLGTGGAFKMIDGKSYLEADKLYIRMKAYFDTLEIRRYIHSGGNRVASAAGCKVTRVVQENPNGSYYCYFKANDGDDKITNDFVAGDLAYCHTTNLAGENQNAELNQQDYWRLVMETGSVNADGDVIARNGVAVSGITDTTATEHYIKLANTTQNVTIGGVGYRGMRKDDDTAPKEGDDVVQLGNVNAPTRQGAIVEAVSGTGCAPTYRIYQGLGADSSNLYTFTSPKVDMGYDLVTHRAYLNVSGDFHFGDNDSYVKFNSGTRVLDIKAKIDASSSVGNGGLTLYGYVNNIAGTTANTAENNAKVYADDKISDYEYLKDALEDGETVIDGGLILTNLIALKNNGGDVTAGITGLSGVGNDIALWLGGLMADWESLTPQQQAVANRNNYAKSLFRFDGSGYLAGSNISWKDNGDTTVKGTVRADNLYHGVCFFHEEVGEIDHYTTDIDPRTDNPYENNGFISKKHYIDGRKYLSTGTCDVVFMLPLNSENPWNRSATTQEDQNVAPNWFLDARTLTLPSPQDFEGKTIEVFIYSFGDLPEERREGHGDGYGIEKQIKIRSLKIGSNGKPVIENGMPVQYPVVVAIGFDSNMGRPITRQEGENYIVSKDPSVGYLRFQAAYCHNTNGSNQTQDEYAWIMSTGMGGVNITNIEGDVYYSEGADKSWVNSQIQLFLDGAADEYGEPIEDPTEWDAYLRLSAGINQCLTDSLFLQPNTAIKIKDGSQNGIDLLSFTSANGNTPAKWALGTGANGIIRSGGELIRKSGNNEYTIYDSSNLTPSNYLLKTDISNWAKQPSKPTYNLDEVADGATRKLSDYATTSALAALNNATVKLSGNNTMTGQNVFQGITTFQSNVFISPNNTLFLQSYDEASRPIDSPAASQAWVGEQGYLTSADLSGYATTDDLSGYVTSSELTTALSGYQTKIRFRNLNNGNNEVTVSDLYLPLTVTNGNASLDFNTLDVGNLHISLTGNNDVNFAHKTSGSKLRSVIFQTDTNANNGGIFRRVGSTDYKVWDASNFNPSDYALESDLSAYATKSEIGTVLTGISFSSTGQAYVFKKNVVTGEGTGELVNTPYALAAQLGGYVTIATEQTISGAKTINNVLTVNGSNSAIFALEVTGAIRANTGIRIGASQNDALMMDTSSVVYSKAVQSGGLTTAITSTLATFGWDNTDQSAQYGYLNFNHRPKVGGVNVALTSDLDGYATGAQVLDVQEAMVTALGVSGDYLTWTAGGQTNNVTVPFATRTMGFKRLSVTGSQTVDANTMTVGGVEYALLANYASTNLWSNMPSGMSYGNVLQLTSASTLSGQLAWDSNHGVTTGVTRKLYWRSRNDSGWGTNGWHTIAFEDWVTTQINTLGDNLQTYVTTQLGGYLPLTAGSSKPLTGNIAYKGTKATYDMITFIDNVGDIYGNGIAIGGGGATIIGGGESAGTMSAQVSGGNEVMYIGNDQGVSIFTNLQNGWSYRRAFNFTTEGNLFMPQRSDTGCLWLSLTGDLKFNAGTGGWATSHMALSNNGSTVLGGWGIHGSGDTLTYLYAGAAYNNTWMVIKPSGNVGIGTTQPDRKLHVNGDFGVGNVYAGSYLFMNANNAGIYMNSTGIAWHNSSNQWTADLITFTSGGNVGIGTSPNYKLEVAGTFKASSNASVGGYLDVTGDINTRGTYNWTDESNFELAVMGAEAVENDANDARALFYHRPKVNGTEVALTSDMSGYLPLSAGSGNALTGDLCLQRGKHLVISGRSTINVSESGHSVLDPNYFAYLDIGVDFTVANYRTNIFGNQITFITGTNPFERMRITADGNVGIGLGGSAPTYKLQVSGTTFLGGAVTLSDTLNAKSVLPTATNLFDLGSSNLKWKNLYISGNVNIGNEMTISNTLNANTIISDDNIEAQSGIYSARDGYYFGSQDDNSPARLYVSGNHLYFDNGNGVEQLIK